MYLERRRTVRRASFAAATLAAIGGIVSVSPDARGIADIAHGLGARTAVERTVEDVAAKLYGKAIVAHCAPLPAGVQGRTEWTPLLPKIHTVRLDPTICNTLGSVIANPAQVDPGDADVVTALGVAAHEYSHVDGAGKHKEGDEGVTQCLGVQRTEQVAIAFGIPPAKAQIIGKLGAAAASAPPRADYTIPNGCTNGGVYDINAPGHDFFPRDPVEKFLSGD